jgi:hypothetical protein
MILASDWFFSGRFVPLGQALQYSNRALSVTWHSIQWLLAAVAVAEGILYSLRARSVKMVLLWSVYVPLIAGFWLWKITNSGTWLTVALAGCSLVWAQRYYARRDSSRDWRWLSLPRAALLVKNRHSTH